MNGGSFGVESVHLLIFFFFLSRCKTLNSVRVMAGGAAQGNFFCVYH